MRSPPTTIRRSRTSSSALGELYAEKQRYYFNQARALDQKIFELPPDQRGPLQAQQKGYEKQEEKWLLEAVKAYIAATKYREVRADGRGAVPARLPAHHA